MNKNLFILLMILMSLTVLIVVSDNVSAACVVGQTRCEPGSNYLQTCQAVNDTWVRTALCAQGCNIATNSCNLPIECTVGSMRCIGTGNIGYQTCAGTGQWQTTNWCAAGQTCQAIPGTNTVSCQGAVNNQRTVSTWIKLDVPLEQVAIWSKPISNSNGSYSTSNACGWFLEKGSNTAYYWAFFRGNTSTVVQYPIGTINYDNWVHVGTVQDGNNYAVYLNGVLYRTANGTNTCYRTPFSSTFWQQTNHHSLLRNTIYTDVAYTGSQMASVYSSNVASFCNDGVTCSIGRVCNSNKECVLQCTVNTNCNDNNACTTDTCVNNFCVNTQADPNCGVNCKIYESPNDKGICNLDFKKLTTKEGFTTFYKNDTTTFWVLASAFILMIVILIMWAKENKRKR